MQLMFLGKFPGYIRLTRTTIKWLDSSSSSLKKIMFLAQLVFKFSVTVAKKMPLYIP